jgi:hypothetical protein
MPGGNSKVCYASQWKFILFFIYCIYYITIIIYYFNKLNCILL